LRWFEKPRLIGQDEPQFYDRNTPARDLAAATAEPWREVLFDAADLQEAFPASAEPTPAAANAQKPAPPRPAAARKPPKAVDPDDYEARRQWVHRTIKQRKWSFDRKWLGSELLRIWIEQFGEPPGREDSFQHKLTLDVAAIRKTLHV
jgi:hypothetical protein